jgi:hypothetical protein
MSGQALAAYELARLVRCWLRNLKRVIRWTGLALINAPARRFFSVSP